MLARNDLIFKWVLYGLAAALCWLVQSVVLQHITIWGVLPVCFPMLVAIPATFESPTAGCTFGLVLGVLTDLMVPGLIPCFCTLLFPLIGLAASLLSQSVLPAGFLCSLVASAMAFLAWGLFSGLVLAMRGKPDWGPALLLSLREMAVSLPLAFPMTILFRAVCARTHLDD